MIHKIDNPEFIEMIEQKVPIDELERRMRPGNYSRVGFLGENESLLNVIAADDDTIRKLGVSHNQVADKIDYIMQSYVKELVRFYDENIKRQRGKKRAEAERSLRNDGLMVDGVFNVIYNSYRGSQHCPWYDERNPATGENLNHHRSYPFSDSEFNVKNTKLDESLFFPGLIHHLIREHNFYEGKHSPYRVDTERAVRILEVI